MAIDTQTTEVGIEPENEATPLFDRYYRLSIEQYQRMAEVGILGPDDRIELLEGLLVEKMTKNPPHAVAVALINQVLPRAVPEGWFLSIESPVSLAETRSVPEPDAQVVRGQPRDYLVRWFGPLDAALVIEVSDTSYGEDRGRKWRMYARSSVPIYWILNLKRRQLEVFTEPSGATGEPQYRQGRTYGPDDEVPLVLDGREVARIAVRDLLP